MEAIALAPAILQEITPEENEFSELQPPLFSQEPKALPFKLFSFLLEDTLPLKKEELTGLLEENNTGIENKVKKTVFQNEEEREEYVKSVCYDTENSYVQKNPYAPKKDYERIEHLKVEEEKEEKSFLWK
ncbi:MAG: hypothetical protein QME12_02695 [Nanoarchaeota archaeon]|nr:hypothetical protein [Nanoarchaeota archaeon]